MENKSQETPSQEAPKRKTTKLGRVKKLDTDSAKLLSSLREKANRKPFGRKVKESEVIAIALTLVESIHIEQLQERTLSQTDRLKIAHEEFQKKNGKITLDVFLGRLLSSRTDL